MRNIKGTKHLKATPDVVCILTIFCCHMKSCMVLAAGLILAGYSRNTHGRAFHEWLPILNAPAVCNSVGSRSTIRP